MKFRKKTEHKLFLSEWEVNVSKDFLQTRMGRRDAAALTPQRFRRPGNPASHASPDFPQTNRTATNDVRTEFHGCSLWLEIIAIQFF